jgi:hypothetical protein
MRHKFCGVVLVFILTACQEQRAVGDALLPISSPTSSLSNATVWAVVDTPTPTPSAELGETAAAMETTATPSSVAASGRYEEVLRLSLVQEIEGEECSIHVYSWFAVGPDSGFWFGCGEHLVEYSSSGQVVRFIRLPLDPEPERYHRVIVDVKVSERGIWFLKVPMGYGGIGVYRLPAEVVHLDFDGALQGVYEVPRKFFFNAEGRYEEFGIDAIRWGGNGELLVEGQTGLHQVLDGHGKYQPVKGLQGYSAYGRFYRVWDWRSFPPLKETKTAILFVDDRRFEFVTSLDFVGLSLVFSPRRLGFDLVLSEMAVWSRGMREVDRIYRYTPAGELLGEVYVDWDEIAGLRETCGGLVPGGDGNWYLACDRGSYDAPVKRVLRLLFSETREGATPLH